MSVRVEGKRGVKGSGLTIMAGGGDDDGGVDGVWVHAALIIVVHADEGPVGHNSRNLDLAIGLLAGDEILNSRGVKELDVGELQDLGQDGAGEERSVLDDDEVGVWTFVVVGDSELAEEGIRWLAHDHGGEELAAEPSTATWGDTGLDDGDLEIWTSLGEAVSGGKTAAAGSHDDDVGLGIVVEVAEVASGHGAGDLTLANVGELEVRPAAGHLLDGSILGVAVHWNRSSVGEGLQLGSRDWEAIANISGWSWLLEVHCWWCHFDGSKG